MLNHPKRLIGKHKTSRKSHRPASNPNSRLLGYETLEPRQLLSADALVVSADGVWRNVDPQVVATSPGRNLIQTKSFGLFDVQETNLLQSLRRAPLEFTPGFETSAVTINVPTPNGRL